MIKKALISIGLFCICFSSVFLVACNGDRYAPELSKSYTGSGFEIKTTEDFVLSETKSFSITLSSDGDNEINFNTSTITCQYDCGNSYYDISNIDLDQYIEDIKIIENIELNDPATIKIKENTGDTIENIDMKMFVVDENSNPTGNWDYYNIYYFGKAQNSFLYFKVFASIQDEYYQRNIEKYNTIISSITFTQPTFDTTYNSDITSYIDETVWSTGDIFENYGFTLDVPTNYEGSENIGGTLNEYVTTVIGNDGWGSGIYAKKLSSFMEGTILDDNGAKHLIKYPANNSLGFYTKEIDKENTSDLASYVYNIYFFNNNILNTNYLNIYVSCSQDLFKEGFINYFEQQLFLWIKTTPAN